MNLISIIQQKILSSKLATISYRCHATECFTETESGKLMLNGSFKVVPNRLVGTKRELSSHVSFLTSLQPGVVVLLALASL